MCTAEKMKYSILIFNLLEPCWAALNGLFSSAAGYTIFVCFCAEITEKRRFITSFCGVLGTKCRVFTIRFRKPESTPNICILYSFHEI